jgi:hypothetical protein
MPTEGQAAQRLQLAADYQVFAAAAANPQEIGKLGRGQRRYGLNRPTGSVFLSVHLTHKCALIQL